LLQLLIGSTGVKFYSVDLDSQTAEVNVDEGVSYETVLEKIKKTGKKVNSGSADGEERSVE
jgi:copper chaperone